MARKDAAVTAAKPTMAEQADIHELYEMSVQNVEHEVEFLQNTFRALSGRTGPLAARGFLRHRQRVLRVGQAGGGVPGHRRRYRSAVLDWGRQNRVGRLPAADQARVQLLESDVMTVETPKVDILVAFNFSYFILDTREQMRTYFGAATTRSKTTACFSWTCLEGRSPRKKPRRKPSTTVSPTFGTRRNSIR